MFKKSILFCLLCSAFVMGCASTAGKSANSPSSIGEENLNAKNCNILHIEPSDISCDPEKEKCECTTWPQNNCVVSAELASCILETYGYPHISPFKGMEPYFVVNDVEALKILMPFYPEGDDLYKVFDNAVYNLNVEVVKYIIDQEIQKNRRKELVDNIKNKGYLRRLLSPIKPDDEKIKLRDYKIRKMLIDVGADIPNENIMPDLAQYGYLDSLKLYVDAGVSLARSPWPDIMLKPARSGQVEVVEYILNTLKDVESLLLWNGGEILDAAAESGNTKMVNLLWNAGAKNVEKAVLTAASKDYLDVLQMLISANGDAVKKDVILETALIKGSLNVAKWLLDNGAIILNPGRASKILTSIVYSEAYGKNSDFKVLSEIVKELTKRGGEYDAYDYSTPPALS